MVLTIITKSSILDVWQGYEYAFDKYPRKISVGQVFKVRNIV